MCVLHTLRYWDVQTRQVGLAWVLGSEWVCEELWVGVRVLASARVRIFAR